MRSWRTAAVLLAALHPLIPQAAAREPVIPRSERPGIGAQDPRRVVDGAAAPWNALGRVQTELGSRCTGTLVAPQRVLTAAHCLVAAGTGGLVRPGSVHFLLGYRQGSWTAHARVTGYAIGPGFQAQARGPAGADWALLTLDAPVGPAQQALPLLRAPPAPGTPLLLGGYQQDRPEVLLADGTCHALGLMQHGGLPLLAHDCAGTRGSSGAPLLVRRPEGGWAVVGVAVTAARGGGLGLAVPGAAVGPEAAVAQPPPD
ncbi:trypsin-like serine peptidase [Roseomonas sp. BN140053]|uniref:trypsin-like serine peptidase n=1 Tax=Roseomonas sp. BN140053 TaxID=3391898 RepID=UPI0039E829DD